MQSDCDNCFENQPLYTEAAIKALNVVGAYPVHKCRVHGSETYLEATNVSCLLYYTLYKYEKHFQICIGM